jgi:hypothetical protein
MVVNDGDEAMALPFRNNSARKKTTELEKPGSETKKWNGSELLKVSNRRRF